MANLKISQLPAGIALTGTDLFESIQSGSNVRTTASQLKAFQDATYNANTILKADVDNTPLALTVGASTFLGRKSTGTIAAMSVAESRTELGAATANGLATLDGGGKVPASQLPSTVMDFKGNWNATTNSPTLADGVGDSGDVYIVNVAGTQNLGSGNIVFAVGDWVIYNGTIWEKSINSNSVVSVFGRTGIVSSAVDDYAQAQISGLKTSDSPTFTGATLSGLSNGLVKSTTGVLSGGNTVSLTTEASGILPLANGGIGIDGDSGSPVFLGLILNESSASAAGPTHRFYKSRSGGIITTGDTLGNMIYSGNDGSFFVDTASIQIKSLGVISNGIVPSEFRFTNTNLAGVAKTNLLINSEGFVGVGTALPLARLHVEASVATGAAGVSVNDSVVIDGGLNNFLHLRNSSGGTTNIQGIKFSDNLSNPGGIQYWHRSGGLDIDRMYFLANGSGKMMIDGPSSNVFIGNVSDTPDSRLHVYTASAGTVTAFAGSTATLESNASAYLSILTPTASEAGIIFGNPGSNVAGNIVYNATSNPGGLSFRGNGASNNLGEISNAGRFACTSLSLGSTIPSVQDSSFQDFVNLGTTPIAITTTIGNDASLSVVSIEAPGAHKCTFIVMSGIKAGFQFFKTCGLAAGGTVTTTPNILNVGVNLVGAVITYGLTWNAGNNSVTIVASALTSGTTRLRVHDIFQ